MKSNKPVTSEHHQPRSLSKTLLSIVAVAMGLMLADHAQMAAKSIKIISVPYSSTEPGNYFVDENLECLGCSAAITIAADNVNLDPGGHTISGDGLGVRQKSRPAFGNWSE